MSALSDFLNPIQPEEQEIYISSRFVKRDDEGNVLTDEEGKPVLRPFRIRPVTQEENTKITKQATKIKKVNGMSVPELDSLEYGRRLVVAGTVEPDFTNSAMCQQANTLDPLEVPGRLLLAGEYAKLTQAITELSGFGESAAAEIQEAAKN